MCESLCTFDIFFFIVDLNLNLTNFKQNELESYKSSIFEECLKNKEKILSQYAKSKKGRSCKKKLT